MLSTRLYKMNTCPSRDNSLMHASRISVSVSSATYVCTGSRSRGAVRIVEMSRIPVKDICNVLGMGVAVIVRQSILLRRCFIFSLCSTPNRCSSSRISSPRSLNFTSADNSLCVPITKSMEPSASPSSEAFVSFGVAKRLSTAIFTPNGSKRFSAVS